MQQHRWLGGWENEQNGNGRVQTVWGEGITVGTMVRKPRVGVGGALGVVQSMGTINEGGGVWVEWRTVNGAV